MRDYEVDHLLGGPDSTRLEFDSDYYRQEFTRQAPNYLGNFLWENPSAIRYRAVSNAASSALDFFNRANSELRMSGVELRYREAAELAIENYMASTGQQSEFAVDEVSFREDLSIPVTELREVGRLAVQCFKVYVEVAATGEVPEL